MPLRDQCKVACCLATDKYANGSIWHCSGLNIRVLCHCRPDIVQIMNRHNRIVDRLTNAIRFGKITTDRTIQDSGFVFALMLLLRSITLRRKVLIIDVTCPFDNDIDALTDAALAKIHKYESLKEFVVSTGRKCHIFPFVVGALGAWYTKNELLMTRLGMTRQYKSFFRKLCCTDAIQGSNNIYRLYLGCDDAALVA